MSAPSTTEERISSKTQSAEKTSTSQNDYTLMTVEFPLSEVNGSDGADATDPSITTSETGKSPSKAKAWIAKHLVGRNTSSEPTVKITMTVEEYGKYFARDLDTKEYDSHVVEPPGGRQAWLQKRHEDLVNNPSDIAYEGQPKKHGGGASGMSYGTALGAGIGSGLGSGFGM